ncbi:GTP cyclohydrolase FolE2 [Actinoplanes sp. NPDC051513]|uniref:GTP cyclohydrolase FolE2 n=1 Tax=Actinoplanes sp. NPDC051513 TaxID=3363908 RepID=UPI00378B271F
MTISEIKADSLQDVQALPDTRGIALDEVGVEGLRYPLLISDADGKKRETVATVTMSVSLADDVKGAHLSRFVDVLHAWRDELGSQAVALMADDLRQRMGSATARVALTFPYFLERLAPVTGIASFMDYTCTLTAVSNDRSDELVLGVKVPVTSVCPCSKAISDRGAHNQRGWVTIDARPRTAATGLWFDDLIDIAEAAGSSPLYALLKRPDERHVTMAGYDKPVFVEDMIRSVAEALGHDVRIAEYRIRVVNDESIHNHAAYAQIPWTPTTSTRNSTDG